MESILVITCFLNRPHCAVGPSCKSDWTEPLGYVGTLGDPRLLVYRTCVLEHQLLDFTSTTTAVILTSVADTHTFGWFTLVVGMFRVIANCLLFQ